MENESHWYAVKVFYNRVFDLEALLEAYGIETYVACEAVELKGRDHSAALKKLADESDSIAHKKYVQIGPVVYKKKTLVNSLLFARADDEHLAIIEEKLSDKDTGIKKGFIYKDSTRKKYSIIPEWQMNSFKYVTSSGDDGFIVIPKEKIPHYNTGDRVRVTDGPFKGCEGHIIRIKKDRRLMVCIEGVLAVATGYIPQKLLEKVEE